MLKKFLNSKKELSEEFRKFYKADLLAENTYLKTKIAKLTPYNDMLSLEVSLLRHQNTELRAKVLKQEDMLVREQTHFQDMEQALI